MVSKMKLDGVPKGSRGKTRIQYDPRQIKKQLIRNEIKYSGNKCRRWLLSVKIHLTAKVDKTVWI